jgi:hypothetical protein
VAGGPKLLFLILFGLASAIAVVNYIPGLRDDAPAASQLHRVSTAGMSIPLDFGGYAPYIIFGLGLCAILVWARGAAR